MTKTLIQLHRDSPSKPATGEPCNGCGACCATEPCPLGVVISRSRTGRCVALEWSDEQGRYQCGVLNKAAATGKPAMRLVARWIAAGHGCDAELELTPAAMVAQSAQLASLPRQALGR